MIIQATKKQKIKNHTQFQNLTAEQKIYNRYFYLRRQRQKEAQKQYQKEIKQLTQISKISPMSYKILVQKLQQKIEQFYHEQHIIKSQLNFQQFLSLNQVIAKHYRYLTNQNTQQYQNVITQLWLLLIGYNLDNIQVSKEKIQNILLILYCPYSLKDSQISSLFKDIFQGLQPQRQKYIQLYPQQSEQILTINEIVKNWIKLRTYRIAQQSKQIIQKKIQIQKQKQKNINKSFIPTINQLSRQLAEKSIQKYLTDNGTTLLSSQNKQNQLSGYVSNNKQISYHDLLYYRKLQKDQILKTNREKVDIKQEQKKLSQYQTKQLIQNLYFKPEKRIDIDYKILKQQEETKLCTFKPSTIQYKKTNAKPTVKGYERQVQRLEKGRKMKKQLQQLYDNLGKVKTRYAKPPSFVDRDTPRLILQVNVGDRIQKIKIKGDQQPRLVAKKFITKHSLDQSMQSVLESIIQQQMQCL